MRVKLKEFQNEASGKLLANIGKMFRRYVEDGELSSTCLQAPTGSGKTVISADVIETLFFGSDERGIEGDERACVLWISESPSLNSQTRNRFMEMSEKLADSVLDHRHVETVGNDFCSSHEELEKRHVYFLSKDLLGSSGLLVKGSESNGGRTFWDVLDKTITDPDRHLYLFIDEAHRGLGENRSTGRGTKTIYANVIDGVGGRAPMPVVIGISATPDRFEQAMLARPDRVQMPTVSVSPAAVQDSGLLKDSIALHIPKDDDQVEHQYVDEACESLGTVRKLWREHFEQEKDELVVPLLVMQVQDGISDVQLKALCEQVSHKLPDLDPQTSFAHVFGTHEPIHPGGKYYIPYVEPEMVAGMRSVQVLFAKEAISTGWDCPRAEVIYSQRRRNDPTYITQLIGRMVRTPLARHIDSNEMLNSVSCYLPEFNPETAQDVVDYLTGKKEDPDTTPGPEPLLDPIHVSPPVPKSKEEHEAEKKAFEKALEEYKKALEEYEQSQAGAQGQITDIVEPSDEGSGEDDQEHGAQQQPEPMPQPEPASQSQPKPKPVQKPRPPQPPAPLTKRDESFTAKDWTGIRDAWDSIVVERVPKGSAKNPFTALLDTATLMMDAGWEQTAGSDVRREFCDRLDGLLVTHATEYKASRHKVEVAEMRVITINKAFLAYNEGQYEAAVTSEDLSPEADDYAVRLASKNADRVFGGKDMVTEYRKRCRVKRKMSSRDTDLTLAAVAISPSVIKDMQDWARKRRDEYLKDHKQDLDYAKEEHRQEYERLQNESGLTIERPVTWPSDKYVAGSGKDGAYRRFPRHIQQDVDGLCPLNLNELERHVVCHEMLRPNAVAFYRNPEKSRTPTAFSFNYKAANGNRAACHPDFIFFMRDAAGVVHPAIVDGHGAWIDDALAKLKGYVDYIRRHPDVFAQVISVSDLHGSDEYRYIDLRDKDTQKAILSFSGDYAESLYRGEYSFHFGNRSDTETLMGKFGVV